MFGPSLEAIFGTVIEIPIDVSLLYSVPQNIRLERMIDFHSSPHSQYTLAQFHRLLASPGSNAGLSFALQFLIPTESRMRLRVSLER
jgi:hypothetical protein